MTYDLRGTAGAYCSDNGDRTARFTFFPLCGHNVQRVA